MFWLGLVTGLVIAGVGFVLYAIKDWISKGGL